MSVDLPQLVWTDLSAAVESILDQSLRNLELIVVDDAWNDDTQEILTELGKRAAEGRETENFIVLDEAIAPDEPAKPRIGLVMLASLMLGLIGGTFIVLAREGAADVREAPKKR